MAYIVLADIAMAYVVMAQKVPNKASIPQGPDLRGLAMLHITPWRRAYPFKNKNSTSFYRHVPSEVCHEQYPVTEVVDRRQ